MYILNHSHNIPQTERQETYPSYYVVNIVSKDKKAKLKLTKDALKLLEHIKIVNEARNLYAEGQVISWEEFIGNEQK